MAALVRTSPGDVISGRIYVRIGGSSDRFAPQLGANPLVTALEAIPPRMRKPEYWFRPSQLLRRLVRDRQGAARDQKVTLPWGAPLTIRRDEAIGQAIWRTGTYDLAVSEALLRLADPGETAVDVGANIGVMASAMAVAVGSTGKVLCFEPHPGLHLELAANIGRWKELLSWNHVERSHLALSEHPGEATLAMSSHFDTNRGTASLADVDLQQTDRRVRRRFCLAVECGTSSSKSTSPTPPR